MRFVLVAPSVQPWQLFALRSDREGARLHALPLRV
jgi:hypothetical protein